MRVVQRPMMSPFDDYLDMAAHCAATARWTDDPTHQSFLIDMAAAFCNQAREIQGSANGQERLAEIAKEVVDLTQALERPTHH